MSTLTTGPRPGTETGTETLPTGPGRTSRVPLVTWLIIILVLLVAAGAIVYFGGTPSGKVLTDTFSQPLNGATSATVDINTDAGNLTIDRLSGGEQMLASGTLGYYESQGLPVKTFDSSGGKATFLVKGGGTANVWFKTPWSLLNGIYNWQIHLNPAVPIAMTAHTGGGNVKVNLAGMAITRLSADTGAGNVDVALPDNAADLSTTAKTGAGNVTVDIGSGITGNNSVNANSGAGNVTVHVPSGIAARIHASSGLGNVSVDPQYSKVGDTYQSPNYDSAANKVEITLNSGAGNVSVDRK